jgi:cytochrome c553
MMIRQAAPESTNYVGLVRSTGIVVVLTLAFVVSACANRQQLANTPNAAAATAPATGEQVADKLQVCSACHGFGGRSISPTFPRLAGLQKDYQVAQLKAFRDKMRADPHARTYMWGMAAHLSDPMIEAISAYYAAQPPVAGTPAASPAIAAGAKIYADGIPAQQILPCQACHGPKAAGKGPIPRLAGQHRAYLARELKAYASKERANPVMYQMAKNLTPAQISEVAAFLAAQ